MGFHSRSSSLLYTLSLNMIERSRCVAPFFFLSKSSRNYNHRSRINLPVPNNQFNHSNCFQYYKSKLKCTIDFNMFHLWIRCVCTNVSMSTQICWLCVTQYQQQQNSIDFTLMQTPNKNHRLTNRKILLPKYQFRRSLKAFCFTIFSLEIQFQIDCYLCDNRAYIKTYSGGKKTKQCYHWLTIWNMRHRQNTINKQWQ